jgi:hypothetical protein
VLFGLENTGLLIWAGLVTLLSTGDMYIIDFEFVSSEMVLQLKGTVWVTRQKQERDLLYYCQASVIIALAVVS